jgi:hypothetical protein
MTGSENPYEAPATDEPARTAPNPEANPGRANRIAAMIGLGYPFLVLILVMTTYLIARHALGRELRIDDFDTPISPMVDALAGVALFCMLTLPTAGFIFISINLFVVFEMKQKKQAGVRRGCLSLFAFFVIYSVATISVLLIVPPDKRDVGARLDDVAPADKPRDRWTQPIGRE